MKKIHQIWITENNQPPPEYIIKKMEKVKNIYDDYEYKLYNNQSIISLLKANFSKNVLLAYSKCNAYAFKADLVRYCILYLYGGYYFDSAVCPEFKFECDFNFMPNGGLVIIDEESIKLLDNCFMYFHAPKHHFLKQAIDQCVENILNHRYGRHPLDITSPMMLNDLNHFDIKKLDLTIIDNRKTIFINERLWLKYKKSIYSSNLKGLGAQGTNSYEELWFKKEMFKGIVYPTK